MGKLTIIATTAIFPITEDETEEFYATFEKGTTFPMTLKVDDEVLIVEINKPKSEKSPEAYTVWSCKIPLERVILYDFEKYPPESKHTGYAKIKVYVST